LDGIEQAAASYEQLSRNDVRTDRFGKPMTGNPPTFHMPLTVQGGRSMTVDELSTAVRTETARNIVNNVIGGDRKGMTAAQQAITDALLKTSTLPPGTPAAAAQRFAALPPAARHAWLTRHLAALRAGQVTLAELP
jgi:hypothetical protein